MSMNKYMHPRNIYTHPPDFKQLAIDFPQYKEYFKLDITGKVLIDFKDPKALRALSTILLKKDFGLDVNIPCTKLVPTIPLRLNYILWLEDILNFVGVTQNIRGIDIGTGASCVYPLLAAKKNGWFMLATEINPESISYAKQNISTNNLENLIKIVQVEKDQILCDIVEDNFDFCMCNPPFFSSTQELHPFFKSRTITRPHPKNAFCASVNEVVSEGGEVEFIKKLANDSKKLSTKIKIYSTMVGHKSNLPAIKRHLRDLEIISFNETEFCQGNTTRWGLAWTFCNFDLKKLPDPVKQFVKNKKSKSPFTFTLPVPEVNDESFDKVSLVLMNLLKELQMTWENVTRNKRIHRYFVSAYTNTWSHQRRKKREKMRSNNNSASSEEMVEEVVSQQKGPTSPSGKRLHEDSLDGTLIKKLKLEESSQNEAYFKFALAIELEDNNLILSLNNVDNHVNRDYLHQILQYIKNNFKKN